MYHKDIGSTSPSLSLAGQLLAFLGQSRHALFPSSACLGSAHGAYRSAANYVIQFGQHCSLCFLIIYKHNLIKFIPQHLRPGVDETQPTSKRDTDTHNIQIQFNSIQNLRQSLSLHVLQVTVLSTSGHIRLKVFSCFQARIGRQASLSFVFYYRLAVLKSLLFPLKVDLKTIQGILIYYLFHATCTSLSIYAVCQLLIYRSTWSSAIKSGITVHSYFSSYID